MTPLLILTHGDFGPLLLRAAEGMFGPQQKVAALGLAVDETREAYLERVKAAAVALGAPPLVLADLACGTPWNTALLAGLADQGEVLAGLSLPLLLESLGLRDLEPRALAAELAARGPQCLCRASELLGRDGGGRG